MAKSAVLNIRILSDAKGAIQGMSQVSKQAGGLGSTVRKVGKVAAVGFGALAAGGTVAALAAEKVASANAAVSNVLGNMGMDDATKRVLDYAESLEKTLGVDENVIKATQAQLATFSALADSADVAGGAFDRATLAAQDMAAAGLGSAETNALQLGKALQDPIKGLTALNRSGVTFTDQQKDQVKAWVEAGKTAKAQNFILGEVEKQVGGTAEATADSSAKFRLAFGEIVEQVGARLLPVMDKLAPVVQEGVDQLGEFADKHGPKVAAAAQQIGDRLRPIVEDVVPKVADAFGHIVEKGQELFGIFRSEASSGGGLAKIGSALQDLGGNVIPVVKDAVSLLVDVFQSDLGRTAIRIVVRSVGAIVRAVSGIVRAIGGIIKFLRGVFTGDWELAWEGIKQLLSGVWDAIKELVGAALAGIRDLLSLAWDGIKKLTGKAWDALRKAVAKQIVRMVSRVQRIPGDVRKGLSKLPGVLKDRISDAFGTARDRASELLGRLVDEVGRVPGRILRKGGEFADAGKRLIGRFWDGMKNVGDLGVTIGKNLLNGVIDMINSGITRINTDLPNKIVLKGLPDIDLPDNPIPKIPRLATGGVTSGPTLALIGDNPSGVEYVIPKEVLDRLDGTGEVTIENVIVLDGEVVDRRINKVVGKQARRVMTGVA